MVTCKFISTDSTSRIRFMCPLCGALLFTEGSYVAPEHCLKVSDSAYLDATRNLNHFAGQHTQPFKEA
jgi:hypothetical protein